MEVVEKLIFKGGGDEENPAEKQGSGYGKMVGGLKEEDCWVCEVGGKIIFLSSESIKIFETKWRERGGG